MLPRCAPCELKGFLLISSRLQMSLQRGINLRSLAEKMGNCSGAEVRGICTEAGESAANVQGRRICIC